MYLLNTRICVRLPDHIRKLFYNSPQLGHNRIIRSIDCQDPIGRGYNMD
jgi:hypothetical protein